MGFVKFVAVDCHVKGHGFATKGVCEGRGICVRGGANRVFKGEFFVAVGFYFASFCVHDVEYFFPIVEQAGARVERGDYRAVFICNVGVVANGVFEFGGFLEFRHAVGVKAVLFDVF